MRHLLVVGLMLAVVAPLSAQTIVQHLPAGPDPQFPGESWNITWSLNWSSWNGRSKPTLMGWGESSNGTTSAVFDKGELQAAIDDAVATYGSWEAQILVSQVNWVTTPMPIQFHPVVGSADVGSSTGYFAYQGDGANSHPKNDWDDDGDPNTPPISYLEDPRVGGTHRNAGPGSSGQWLDAGGNTQSMFYDAVTAGLTSGASALDLGPAWTQFLWTDIAASWTVEIDATSVVQHYVNSDALLLFASALGDIGMTVFGCNQWGGQADIRVQITPEPVSLALLAMGGLVALRRRR